LRQPADRTGIHRAHRRPGQGVAEGLAEEIGSDLFACDPIEALEILDNYPGKRATPEQQTVGRKRRIRKKA
jgi:hypothetical protein